MRSSGRFAVLIMWVLLDCDGGVSAPVPRTPPVPLDTWLMQHRCFMQPDGQYGYFVENNRLVWYNASDYAFWSGTWYVNRVGQIVWQRDPPECNGELDYNHQEAPETWDVVKRTHDSVYLERTVGALTTRYYLKVRAP